MSHAAAWSAINADPFILYYAMGNIAHWPAAAHSVVEYSAPFATRNYLPQPGNPIALGGIHVAPPLAGSKIPDAPLTTRHNVLIFGRFAYIPNKLPRQRSRRWADSDSPATESKLPVARSILYIFARALIQRTNKYERAAVELTILLKGPGLPGNITYSDLSSMSRFPDTFGFIDLHAALPN